MKNLNFQKVTAFLSLSVILLFFQNFTPNTNASPASLLMPPEMRGKMFVGYQGWFNAPGDKSNRSWSHWGHGDLNASNADSTITVDMWPDVSEYSEGSLTQITTGPLSTLNNKKPAKLFSSLHPDTTALHMSWMNKYGIEGAFMQRFVSEMRSPQYTQVLRNALSAAEVHKRKIIVTYDITRGFFNPDCYKNRGRPDAFKGAANPDFSIAKCIKNDWLNLLGNNKKHVSTSDAYLKVTIGGTQKPLVALWGFGFNPGGVSGVPGSDYIYNTDDAQELINWFHQQGIAVMGGVPTFWSSQAADTDSLTDRHASDAGFRTSWSAIYKSFDIISPWMVGRVSDDNSINLMTQKVFKRDLAITANNRQGYFPVIFPGYSFYNTATLSNQQDTFALNQIPRSCGRFFWKQFSNYKKLGLDSYYVAMFDEVNEGTSIFKTAAKSSLNPQNAAMISLDADGCDLPNDWYLTLVQAMATTTTPSDFPFMPKPLPRACDLKALGAIDPSYASQTHYLFCLTLGRYANDAELKTIAPALQKNQKSLNILFSELTNSYEYQIRYKGVSLTNKDFIYLTYRLYLLRDPDAGGLQNYQNLLDSRRISRAQLAQAFFASAEFGSRHPLLKAMVNK